MDNEQYKVVADQRLNFNTLVWQTPALCLAAQAFLSRIAFDPDRAPEYRIASIVLILLVSLVCMQLLAKHHAFERRCSKLLFEHEKATEGWQHVHDFTKATGNFRWPMSMSSRRLWSVLLLMFYFAGVWAGYLCIRDWRNSHCHDCLCGGLIVLAMVSLVGIVVCIACWSDPEVVRGLKVDEPQAKKQDSPPSPTGSER